MKKLVEKLHENYTKQYPGNDKLLQLIHEDLIDSNGHPQKARGLALNAIYHLDGGTKRRPQHQMAFDKRLSPEEKAILGDEAHKLAEIAMMLYHPAFVISKEEAPSENRAVAQNALHRIMRVHGARAAEPVERHLLCPMYKLLLDEVMDDSNALNALLPDVMVHGTDHDRDDYKKLLMMHFLGPSVHGITAGFWEYGIPEYMMELEKQR